MTDEDRRAKRIEGRECERCHQPLTLGNTGQYGGFGACDVCEWHIRDDLAWMTGSGRWSQ